MEMLLKGFKMPPGGKPITDDAHVKELIPVTSKQAVYTIYLRG